MRIRLALLWISLGMSGIGTTHAAAQARSIQSFVEAKDRWESTIGASWRLEGRYSIIGRENLRFVNCPMLFVLGPGVTPPAGRRSNLEVTGSIEKRQGKLVFVVSSIRVTSSDMERLLLEKAKIDSDESDDWYKLAAWAKERGAFYSDLKLQEAAEDLYQSGLEIEFRQLDSGDLDGLARVIKKARSFKLPETRIEDFLHSGYWQRYRFLQDKQQAAKVEEFSDLQIAISNDLKGARQPVAAFDQQAFQQYLAQPQQKYELASAKLRKEYERYFYLEVLNAKVRRLADASGKNAFSVASMLQREAPEQKELIEQFMQLGLKYELSRVDVMTRQEMIDLAQRFESQDDRQQAEDIKRRWLLSREGLYTDEGPRGLADYADEWIQLLNDRDTAAKYYISAWKLNPQNPRANSWLTDNGWTRHQGEWVREHLVPQRPESAIERAMREGRIEKGMSTSQVKTTMGVAPDSLVRFATSGKVTELWVYEAAKIIVRFTWSLGDAEPQVESIQAMATDSR